MNKPLKVTHNIVHFTTPITGGFLIGRYATKNARAVYQDEKHPPFSPPGKIYPIVWT